MNMKSHLYINLSSIYDNSLIYKNEPWHKTLGRLFAKLLTTVVSKNCKLQQDSISLQCSTVKNMHIIDQLWSPQ